MKVNIICIGKIKEDFFKAAVAEYSKRLSKFVKLNIIELDDEKVPQNISDSQKIIIKNKEGIKIIKNINNTKNSFSVSLDINGKKFSSEKFADFFSNSSLSGISEIYFIIGGSIGLSDDVIKSSNFVLSFSDMTFPHQLMRIILLEQIYRAFKIINNEPYHK